ncbi:hypothetical protein Mapa_001915 [Marchantia paleacea]|nr:hypothetical protein Mapa_001915 [Marchantia paleacea]
MSEASSITRHPYKANNGPFLKFQQSSDASSLPPMARPMASRQLATSHTAASNVSVAGDDGIDAELWYACAGPQKALPPVGSVVAYLPQGHIEQVASFNNQELDAQIPRYNLPAVIPCMLNDIQLSADPDSDEVYATLTLCPMSEQHEDSSDCVEPPQPPKRKSRSFTKTLTVSDTSTHGGFSVPRRAADDCLPKLDMSLNPPNQELVAKDLHGNEWRFRHIFRGQPKRHLLTTGWSVFVSQKRLVAGDAVLFLRGENGQLRVGVRRAPRQQQLQPKVLTSPTMHIGVLAAAAHAATEKSRFSLIYNPRSCPSEFVIPYSKYLKAVKSNFNVGQRFKMKFESEDPSDRRHTGTITGICDFDPARWPGSEWRSLQVNWDESSSSERQERVSPWEVEPFSPSTTVTPSVSTRKRLRPVTQPHSETAMSRNAIETNKTQTQTMRLARAFHGGHELLPSSAEEEDAESLSAKMSWIKREDNFKSEVQSVGSRQGPESWMSIRRPEPVQVSEMFRNLPASGVQDLRGVIGIERRQQEHLKFCVKQYRENKDEISGTTLQLSSPRPPNLQNYVKSSTDLNLSVSSPASSNKGSSLLWPNPQSVTLPSYNGHESTNASSWLSFRPGQSDVAASSPHCTTLSMSNLPPADSENSSHPSTPKSYLWEKRLRMEPDANRAAAPVHSEQKCKIFGVPLDKPTTIVIPSQVPGSKVVRSTDDGSGPSSSRGLEKVVSPSPTSSAVGGQEQDKGPQRSNKASQNFQQGPVRSYTKIHKQGSFGRSIDVQSYDGYTDLLRKVENMFELNGELFDKKSGWQLVYTDHEDDVLLVGDDPWMEFVSCVRTLRLLSPGEASSSGKSGQSHDEDAAAGKDGAKRCDSSSPSAGARGDDM